MPRIPIETDLENSKEEAIIKSNSLYGFVPAYSNADYNSIKWNDTEQAIELSSADPEIGMAQESFRVDKVGAKFHIKVKLKGSVAGDTGIYVRVYEYNADLPNGISHISNTATNTAVQEDTSGKTDIYENSSITTDWTTISYDYTPTAGAKWASIVVLNWGGYGTNRV